MMMIIIIIIIIINLYCTVFMERINGVLLHQYIIKMKYLSNKKVTT